MKRKIDPLFLLDKAVTNEKEVKLEGKGEGGGRNGRTFSLGCQSLEMRVPGLLCTYCVMMKGD